MRTQAEILEVGLTLEEVTDRVVSVLMVVGSWAQTEAARIATRANFLANIIVEKGGGKKR